METGWMPTITVLAFLFIVGIVIWALVLKIMDDRARYKYFRALRERGPPPP